MQTSKSYKCESTAANGFLGGPTHSSAGHLAEQTNILASNSLVSAFVLVIRSCVNTSVVGLEYPGYGKRSVCGYGPLRVIGSALSHICLNSLPQLASLSIQHLELEDLPDG